MVGLRLRLLMRAQDRVTARCSGCHQSVKPYTFLRLDRYQEARARRSGTVLAGIEREFAIPSFGACEGARVCAKVPCVVRLKLAQARAQV